MKILLIILSFLIFCIPASSQTTYSNSYDIAESSDNAFRIFKKDSLMFTVSLSVCGIAQSNISCTGILCTNLAGEEQWRTVIDSSYWINENAVTITEDFLYLALQSRSQAYQGPQIHKVAFSGDVIESANIIEEDNFRVSSLHKVEDGFKLYAGNDGENIEIYGAMIYLNEDYEQVSFHRYTPMDMTFILPVTEVELGDAGSNVIIRYIGTDELARTTMIRLDTVGNVLWTYPMLDENTPISSNIDIFYVPDDGFYVTFVTGDPLDPFNPFFIKYKLAKFSDSGNLIWSRNVNQILNVGIFNTFMTADQQIVGAGLIETDTVGPLQGYLTRFDLDGNVLWERIIFEEEFSNSGFYLNHLNNGLELDNGDLLFCGSVNDENSGTPGLINNTWLVRTTADGCLDIDDCDNLTPTEEVALLEQKDFILYPNPAGNYITVDAENFLNQDEWDILIFNASGQLESEVQVNAFPHQINTQSLAAGFYFMKLRSKKGLRKMLKFVRG